MSETNPEWPQRGHGPMEALKVSVVVPIHNAEENIKDLIARTEDVLDGMGITFELVLVNDGSRDSSWLMLETAASRNPRVCAINLMRNYGQHNALLCGIRRARYPVVITMDDDLQHPPEECVRLLGALTAATDVVYGTPLHQPHGLLRGFASKVTKWTLQGVLGAEMAAQVSAFRVFRTHLREAFANYRGAYVSIDVLLTWGTSRFSAIKVRHDPRKRGRSGYSFRQLATHGLNMLTGFTTWPLHMVSIAGFALTGFGLVVLAYVVGRFILEGTATPGFPFLASLIAIFSGAQLFALGIIGEYLARMHFRMMDRPGYCEREVVKCRAGDMDSSG
jgi:glycosyltransferase involved in cell wall biosynthesis